MERSVKIEGMSCGHCAAAVREELEKIPGVSAVAVDVQSKTATFKAGGEVGDDRIAKAVVEAGYEVVK